MISLTCFEFFLWLVCLLKPSCILCFLWSIHSVHWYQPFVYVQIFVYDSCYIHCFDLACPVCWSSALCLFLDYNFPHNFALSTLLLFSLNIVHCTCILLHILTTSNTISIVSTFFFFNKHINKSMLVHSFACYFFNSTVLLNFVLVLATHFKFKYSFCIWMYIFILNWCSNPSDVVELGSICSFIN